MKIKSIFGLAGVKQFCKTALLGVFAVAVFGLLAPKAFAMTPTLSVYSNGNNSVQITVNGDSNSSVLLYYYPSYSGSITSTNIGSTNQNGYFSTTVNSNVYNMQQNSSVYVLVNGSQSNTIAWPYNNYNGGGNIYLNQTSLYVNSGQSVSDYINGGSGSYYISSNSNSGVASVSISGNTINVYGNYTGSTNVSICSNSSSYGCVTLYISVNGNNNYNNNYPPISLSQSSVSIGVGQTVNVGISGGTGIYYISSNTSNQYVASASNIGGALSIYGRQVGSETVTVCSSIVNNYNNNYNNGNNYSFNSCADIAINVGVNYSTTNYISPLSYVNPNIGGYTSGVFLNQIPYTGAGTNNNVTIFVIGLWIWSASIAYFIFKKTRKNSSLKVASSAGSISKSDLIAKFKRENLERKGN